MIIGYIYLIIAGNEIRKANPNDVWKGHVFFLFYCFMMVLPWLIGGFVHKKERVPFHSFSCIIGWIVAGAIYYVKDEQIGIYQIYLASLILLSNLISQKDWVLYWRDLIYFFLFGIFDCWAATEIMVEYNDVFWIYLQFIYVYLFTLLSISLKIDKWAIPFALGWALYSIFAITIKGDEYTLFGIYNLIAPGMLAWGVFHYFFKIYKPNRDKMFVENPSKRKMVKP